MLHHPTQLIETHQCIMTLQLKHTRLEDACASFSTWDIREDFSNVKRYSTELARQSIWSLQKSFCPSFCRVWENSYFPCFLAHWPSHLLTSGSSLDSVCTQEYLPGNKSEGSLDPAKHIMVSILCPHTPHFKHRPSSYLSAPRPDFFQSGCLSLLFVMISLISWVQSGLSKPGNATCLEWADWNIGLLITATNQTQCHNSSRMPTKKDISRVGGIEVTKYKGQWLRWGKGVVLF